MAKSPYPKATDLPAKRGIFGGKLKMDEASVAKRAAAKKRIAQREAADAVRKKARAAKKTAKAAKKAAPAEKKKGRTRSVAEVKAKVRGQYSGGKGTKGKQAAPRVSSGSRRRAARRGR